ncbi:next to BRCA1 gene 1 protein isoform X2 [Carettochelys insculpta]|uniref:next to BRCA1 gene 1 protein isoform X2 n=1 Tax=Carettochelys insculpta TaxID=44489 RepID=UPI003EBFE657
MLGSAVRGRQESPVAKPPPFPAGTGRGRSHSMEPQVILNVSFKGETQSFLVSDSLNTTWADVEAMVKVSFDLNNIQIKYTDEDNDEVSVNSEEEYEEALKIAVTQGNQLQMKVYEVSSLPSETSYSCFTQVGKKAGSGKTSISKDGKKPLSHYSMLAHALGQDLKAERETTEQQKLNQNKANGASEKPPEWFTRYLESFREQVVKETVEKLEQKLSEKLILHHQALDSSISSTATAQPAPETQSTHSSQCDWLIFCSNCHARIVGIRYQCSVCPAYSICEPCEGGTYAHDPNHVLLKLRRPVVCVSETYSIGQFSPRLPATLEQVRLQKQMDKRFLKAEKQRLRAEKKQRKAEVRELKKQLKLHRKIHLWNSVHALEITGSPAIKPESLQPSALTSPIQPCPTVVPTLSAAFVDENLPDGTHIQPGTKFIKHWRMKNTGNVEWSSDTKLKFMWGNLTLGSSEKKDVLVPSLPAGQVGIVSVEFIAPALEGTYASHWRLSHKGEQFGPRVWCSIVVDPLPDTTCLEKNQMISSSSLKDKTSCSNEVASSKAESQQSDEEKEQTDLLVPAIPLKMNNIPCEREFYIPSVDLLTAQDLLSFELLDINIVQELERVPHNTPVDMTPCMSPLPHDGPLIEKPGLGQIEEENEGSGFKPVPDADMLKVKTDHPVNLEEGEEDMSGTQFVCETVIRSLTLDAAPDHKPPQRRKSLQSSLQILQDTFSYSVKSEETTGTKSSSVCELREMGSQRHQTEENKFEKLRVSDGVNLSGEPSDAEDEEDDVKDEVQSQASSASSEDYIIILPECFDTSRPLGESMYSSALSQPSLERTVETEREAVIPAESQAHIHNINDILTTSQTLEAVPLTPEIVGTPPQLQRYGRNPSSVQSLQKPNLPFTEDVPSSVTDQIGEEPRSEDFSGPAPSGIVNDDKLKCPDYTRHPQGSSIAGGLVKGALSVAASAYKALFAGQSIEEQPTATEEQTATLLANLSEMGFCDRQLNLRLLKKHNYNIVQVVTELLQINNDWYSSRY